MLYHPASDEDLVRAELRVTAEQVKANQHGLKIGAFLSEFNKEVARNYGPGSSWSDEEREKWEQELRQATVETVERAFGNPADAANRAIDGMIEDDRKAATGKGAFERALDAELDKHDSHARQNMPHARAMAESAARDWKKPMTSPGSR